MKEQAVKIVRQIVSPRLFRGALNHGRVVRAGGVFPATRAVWSEGLVPLSKGLWPARPHQSSKLTRDHLSAFRATLAKTVVAGLLLQSAESRAGLFTGNPATDGWANNGNSLAQGTFIRETASWNYNVYGASSTLTAGNPVVNGTTWQVGDQVIGMGAVMNGVQPIMPRLVAKFGSAAATFSAASSAADYLPPSSYNDNSTVHGDGHGSFSTYSGSGGFMVTYTYKSDYPSYALNPASQNNAILTPVATDTYYNSSGTQVQLTSGDFGRVLAIFATDNNGNLITQNDQRGNPSSMPELLSFEVLVNVSDMLRSGYSLVPSVNGRGDMTLQFKSSSYTDSLVTSFAQVPEPATCASLAVGVLAAACIVERVRGRRSDSRSRSSPAVAKP